MAGSGQDALGQDVPESGSGGPRVLWLVLFLTVFSGALAAPVVGSSPADDTVEAVGDGRALDEGELSARLDEGYAAQRRRLRRRQTELRSPRLTAERARSRVAYRGLGAAASARLLARTFGNTLSGLEADPARYLSDAKLVHVVDANAATVREGGEVRLFDASVSVRAEDAAGRERKVDLGLLAHGSSFEPVNPLVDVSIARDVAGGVALGEAGVTITQAGAEQSVGRIQGDKNVFFPEASPGSDTDLLVAPLAGGVELFDMLRSPASRESLRFDLQLPRGSSLRPAVGGGAEVLDADGKTTLLIPEPSAVDAQGTHVPVAMRVDGDALVLGVEHRAADLAYPIMVDPTILQDWTEWNNGQHLSGLDAFQWQQSGGWSVSHGTSSPGFPGYEGKGLFVTTPSGAFAEGQYGSWFLWAPNSGSFLSGATLSPFVRNDGSCSPATYADPHDYDGMWTEAGTWNQLLTNDAVGTSTLTASGDALVFGMATGGSGSIPCVRSLMLGGVSVLLDDRQDPTISVTGSPSSWVKLGADPVEIEYLAGDAGLGVRQVRVSGNSHEWTLAPPLCAGTYEDRCPTSREGTISFAGEEIGVEGEVALQVEAVDPLGKSAQTARTVKLDGLAPTVELSGEATPAGYELAVTVEDGGATAEQSGVSEVEIYLDGEPAETRTPSCSASGCPTVDSFTYTQSLSGLAVGEHTIEVVAHDLVGHQGSEIQEVTLEAPDTEIDSGPEGLTNQTTPEFTYHSTLSGSSFECSVDGEPAVSCAETGYATVALADGPHTFSVAAVSPLGITDPTPATRSFEVDGTAPDTAIDFGPEGLTAIDEPAFSYSSDDPEATFECRLDEAEFASCPEDEYIAEAPLADGEHSFEVRAVDLAGNVDPSPASSTFGVAATSPVVEITSGPEGLGSEVEPTFGFVATGGEVSCAFESLDPEPPTTTYGPCTTESSYAVGSPLADGTYAFEVRAIGAAENESVDSRIFTVDTTAPETTIRVGPSGTTDRARPRFEFGSSEPRVSFACRFDGEAFRPCSGPGSADEPEAALEDGSHTFEVRATDEAGNVDPTPAARTFTVYTAGPPTTINSGTSGSVAKSEAEFKFTSVSGASFQCSLDGGAFSSCASPEKLTGLEEGEHNFEVRAVLGGNVDPTPATRRFVVDTSPPSQPVVSGPLTEPGVQGLTLQVEGADGALVSPATVRSGVAEFRVRVDGKIATTVQAPCAQGGCVPTSTQTIQVPYQQAVGSHHFAVEAVDGVGHISPAAEWDETAPEAQELLSRKNQAPKPPDCPPIHVIKVKASAKKTRGTECADLIVVVGSGEHTIEALGGNDIILGGPATDIIRAGEGNDFIRARRSNDVVYGEGGNDVIYGGIGDDSLFGGEGDDLLDGGPGGDGMDGGEGNDTLRGGQGENHYTGGSGEDTFSFADAVSPGFSGGGSGGFEGFPGSEPGVLIDLGAGRADDGPINLGGQEDTLHDHPERVVGSAFADHIIGTSGSEEIDGGPGADLIEGNGGGDQIVPDPLDHSEGDPAEKFEGRDPARAEVGMWDFGNEANFYLAGSKDSDKVTVRRGEGSIQFVAAPGSASPLVAKSPCSKHGRTVNCPLHGKRLGMIVVSGAGGNDVLGLDKQAAARPGAFELLGGNGTDELRGSPIEDLLVDGKTQKNGVEYLRGGAGDDAILSGSGGDVMEGGKDNDLLIAGTICRRGDAIYGDLKSGERLGSDNAQFHFIKNTGVRADLGKEELGEVGAPGGKCSNGTEEPFSQVDILEGTPKADFFKGNDKTNLLLGRGGSDKLLGEGGVDKINALDGRQDRLIDCGGQPGDKAAVDPQDEVGTHIKHCRHRTHEGPSYPTRPWVPLSSEGFNDAPNLPEEEAPPLSSYFPLDESSGTEAANRIDSTQPGEYSHYENIITFRAQAEEWEPAPTLGEPGVLRGFKETGVRLDGYGDFVNLGFASRPREGAEGFSVSTFVKFDRAPEEPEFIFSAGDYPGGAFLYRNFDGRLVFSSGLEWGAPMAVSAEPIEDSAWHHVVGVLDKDQITLYVDGFPYTHGYGDSVERGFFGDSPDMVGSPPREPYNHPTTTSEFLGGEVDQLMTYEGALDEAEVQAQLTDSVVEEPEILLAPEPETVDSDEDGVPDAADNCPNDANPDQADTDMNGIGDACDPLDSDGDGVSDGSDNCPFVYNPDQADSNGDGIGDECGAMPPSVATAPAADVEVAGATLSGTVNPEGQETTYRLEYGLTTSYGSEAPAGSEAIGSGADELEVSQTVTGLEPDTTYHFRLVADNETGETPGEDQSFTTEAASPPVVLTEAASAIGITTATLNGSVDPEGSATTYQFAYGTTTGYGETAPVTPAAVGSASGAVAVSEALTGLEPDTTYHFRVEATNAGGTAVGEDMEFTTEPLPPPVVLTEAASAIGITTATLNGSVDPEGSATTYQFAYGTTTGYGETAPVTPAAVGSASGAVAVSEALTGLEPDTTYHFRVEATNAGGTAVGEDMEFTTEPLPPPVVLTEAASAIGITTATLNGSVDPEGSATTYQFAYGTTTGYGETAPVTPAAVGSASGAVAVSEALTGLEPDTTYHFRVEATNAGGTAVGEDMEFTTEPPPPPTTPPLASMPIVEPFNGTSSSITSFTANFGTLGWAGGANAKGADTTEGWRPVDAFSTVNGAYYAPSFSDAGDGLATVATMANDPNINERYFSLWLDMSEPTASTRNGYELSFTYTATDTYTVALSKWSAGSETVLASEPGYSFVAGDSLAIVDQGATISAWTDTGGGFEQLLSAADNSLSSGRTGLEGSGNITRLVDFKAGALQPVANMNAALNELDVLDPFNREESVLSWSGAWEPLAWDSSTSHRTGRVVASEGWGPWDAFSEVNGAYWAKASFADSGSGDAVVATQSHNPTITERYFSLWLDMPEPDSVKSGYELRFKETSENARIYEVTLAKWQSGTRTVLATETGYTLPTGSRFAIVEKGGVVSAWTDTGSGFAQLLSASDSAFDSGFVGIEGSGNISRTTDFKAGALAAFSEPPPPPTTPPLASMPIVEPFNGTSSSITSFTANFGTLGWAGGANAKGADTTEGWRPVDAFSTVNGAYYAPSFSDAGDGLATVATMANDPNINERYFSLWLDMSEPTASTRNGYELSFTYTATDTYTVALSKWSAGSETVLASEPGYSFVAGDSLAIVDQGATISAWTDTGGGFEQLLSAADNSLSSGRTGLEGSGNITRLVDFKAGALQPVANMNAALNELDVLDPFNREESVLSWSGAWEPLAWDSSTSHRTGRVVASEGWGPWDAFSEVNGAYWAKASFADSGSGDAVVATQSHNPTITERYFSLWLDMPEPDSVKSGYELRFKETSENARIYEVTLAKWQSGTRTVLATETGYTLPTGSRFAIVEKGGVVSAWTDTGSGFAQLLSASDSAFDSGFVGIEGSGNISRTTDFKAGALAAF